MALLAVMRNGLTVNQSLPQCLLCWRKTNSSSLKNTVKYVYSSSINQNYLKLSPKASAKKQLSDQVPADYTLIYQSPMENYLKICYPVMLCSVISFSGLWLLHYYGKLTPLLTNPTNSKRKYVFLNTHVESFIYLGGLFLFTAAVFAIVFKIPFRIYKHNMEKKYIAIFLNPIPTKMQQHHYKTATQAVFMNPIYSVFNDCHYLVGTKKAILFDYHFRTPADFLEMVGMD